jgi:hypothetical protein
MKHTSDNWQCATQYWYKLQDIFIFYFIHSSLFIIYYCLPLHAASSLINVLKLIRGIVTYDKCILFKLPHLVGLLWTSDRPIADTYT